MTNADKRPYPRKLFVVPTNICLTWETNPRPIAIVLDADASMSKVTTIKLYFFHKGFARCSATVLPVIQPQISCVYNHYHLPFSLFSLCHTAQLKSKQSELGGVLNKKMLCALCSVA